MKFMNRWDEAASRHDTRAKSGFPARIRLYNSGLVKGGHEVMKLATRKTHRPSKRVQTPNWPSGQLDQLRGAVVPTTCTILVAQRNPSRLGIREEPTAPRG